MFFFFVAVAGRGGGIPLSLQGLTHYLGVIAGDIVLLELPSLMRGVNTASSLCCCLNVPRHWDSYSAQTLQISM